MAKYKRGQKVRVRKDLVYGRAYPMDYQSKKEAKVYSDEDTERFKGQIVTIFRFSEDNDAYYIYEGLAHFTDSMLEPIENYTVKDLKDGMVVEYVNGVRRMVMGKKLIGQHEWNDLSYGNYTEDLSNVHNPNYTIAKVYTSESNTFEHYFSDENLKLIWERSN